MNYIGWAGQQYVVEALADEPNLTVTGVTLEQDGTMEVALDWRGEVLTVTVETGGS